MSEFIGMLSFDRTNSHLVNGFLREKNRFSVWKDDSNFTTVQIEKIFSNDHRIHPGAVAKIIFTALNSTVTNGLRVGDVVDWGVPHTSVGRIEILEIDSTK